MMRTLVAWVYLAVAFWKHVLLLRPWRHRFGLARFRANYAPDGLRALTADERRTQPRHSRCIDCGLCVAAFVPSGSGRAEDGGSDPAPAAPQWRSELPALPVRWSRAGHDAWAVDEAELAALLGSDALAAAEAVCPTCVPLEDVGRFVLRARRTLAGPA